MGLQLNFTGVQASQNFEPVPAGTYEVAVNSVKPKKSSTNKPMLEWVFEIQADGPFWGHRIFTNTILEANSLWRTKDYLLALGFTEEELAADFELDPAELVGLTAMAVVTVEEYQGQMRNKVVRLNKLPAPVNVPAMAEEEELDYNGEVSTDTSSVDDGYDDGFESDSDADDDDEVPPAEEYVIPDNIKISAAARKLAMAHQVPLDQITPTGPGKSYVQKDVESWVNGHAA